MPKVSRPVIWSLVGAAAIYAVFLYTQPDAPAAKHIRHVMSESGAAPQDPYLADDTAASFKRYKAGGRNPFEPVSDTKPVPPPPPPPPRVPSGWALTGVSAVNGVPSALIENASTKETQFLKAGDQWGLFKVVSVMDTRIVLADAAGHRSEMSFDGVTGPDVAPPALPGRAGRPNLTMPSVTNIAPLPAVGSLPPMPTSVQHRRTLGNGTQ